MLGKIRRVIADPSLLIYKARASMNKDGLRRQYQELARKQGFRRPFFLLSFDCDTELDIAVAEEVHAKLHNIGITPVYAVPGELLEKGAHVYRKLADAGAEFINHGYRIHTIYDSENSQYVSTVFYDQLTPESIEEDIRLGDATVRNIIGRPPKGFRVPHFGTYSSPAQLHHLHDVLKRLGYRFSSSTIPRWGFRYGPAPRLESGLYEIPVSGCFDEPLRILDSWSFRYAPDRAVSASDYEGQLEKLAQYFTKKNHVGFLNIYADPSQVHDWPAFFDGLRPFADIAAPSFETILGEIEQ